MRLFFALIIIGSILFQGACRKKFLDVSPIGQQTSAGFFKNAADAEKAVTSCYGHLNEWRVVGFAHLAITSITSDDAEKGSVPGDAAFLNDFDNFTFTSSQFEIDDYWTGQYAGINLCNQCIDNIPKITMDPALQSRFVAEAKFIRALHYFNLVRAFGDVPKVDHLPLTPEDLNPVRAPKADIYALIESDLNEAATILPVSYPATEIGRATKGAALGMLAKVKMYEKKWAEVLALTNQVLALPYSLMSDYYRMFRVAYENNSESLFEVQANTFANDCGTYSQYSEVQWVRPVGWGFNVPTLDLANAYEAGDVRRAATIIFSGETTQDGDVIPANSPNPRYNKKIYVPSSVPNACGYAYGRDQNRRILRLGEIYLIKAEAANELNDLATATAALNIVRARAGLTAVTGLNQNDLRLKIWNERHIELAMEDDRFFDLVRQGRAGVVLRAQGKQFVDGKNEIFPIPERQIILSGHKLTQNPNY